VRRAAAPDAELVKRARGRLDGDGSPAASAKQTTAGLDAFLAKDMRAWADLCAEDVLVEFPFAPAGTPSRLDDRVAIFEYLRNYPKIIDVHEIGSLEILCRAKNRMSALSWCFLRSLGCSPVFDDQALDGLPALDPGGHIDRLAGLVQLRSLFSRLVGR
jgi:hypothetical protein